MLESFFQTKLARSAARESVRTAFFRRCSSQILPSSSLPVFRSAHQLTERLLEQAKSFAKWDLIWPDWLTLQHKTWLKSVLVWKHGLNCLMVINILSWRKGFQIQCLGIYFSSLTSISKFILIVSITNRAIRKLARPGRKWRSPVNNTTTISFVKLWCEQSVNQHAVV